MPIHNNILYIAESLKTACGGSAVMKRNYNHLIQIFGKDNVYTHTISTDCPHGGLYKLFMELKTCSIFRYTDAYIKELERKIIDYKIKYVFFDSSLFGNLIKYLKRKHPYLITVCFFHNVETIMMKEHLKLSLSPKFLYRIAIAFINERNACRASDKIITLNKRDFNIINKIYKRKADYIIPVTLEDKPLPYTRADNKTGGKPCGLFVGSFFPPNVQAVEWLVQHVMPYVNMEFIVCGSGMDKLADKYKGHNNMKIHGYVSNLEDMYRQADFILMPIMPGSGMKVKTAEALQHAKLMIASREAVEGYDVTQTEAIVCETPDDYIKAITNKENWGRQYNKASRDLFESMYSFKSSINEFKKLFNRL